MYGFKIECRWIGCVAYFDFCIFCKISHSSLERTQDIWSGVERKRERRENSSKSVVMNAADDDGARKRDIRFRPSLRGVKRCACCGHVNGQRALICQNEKCEQRQRSLQEQHPFDPVQLVSHTGTALYSLRCKERLVQSRNFVAIRGAPGSIDSKTSLLSRKFVCFVDACKCDTRDASGASCKHIRACTADSARSLPWSEVYTIAREVLWNLNISLAQKQRLWAMYKEDEQQVPAVQRLNATLFAVKSEPSKECPAGRVHVTAVSNSMPSKKGTYACACKNVKIIVEHEHAMVMQEEICDHLLLVLAAILSKHNGKALYERFTNALKSLWMPLALEIPLVDASNDDAFFGTNISLGAGGSGGSTEASTDDIFIFGNELLPSDNIPDLSDIILDFTPTEIQSSRISAATPAFAACDSLGDPNMMSSCNPIDEDADIKFHDLTAITTATSTVRNLSTSTKATINGAHLELSDCKIELMDQFQLTDQIDLCSEDISLPSETSSIFGNNSISILSASLATEQLQPMTINSIDTMSHDADLAIQNTASLLKPTSQVIPQLDSSSTLPPIEMPTITVVKKCPVKSQEIVTEVKARQAPHIPAKRALIVNLPEKQRNTTGTEPKVTAATEPSLAYSAWLEYVIETINESIQIKESRDVLHTFHVHEEIFAHLSKTFSVGYKRRLPNGIAVIKSGKHKGLTQYTWLFILPSTVRRIFSTKNIAIEIERAFEINQDGAFVPYVRSKTTKTNDKKHKYIYPKLSLYMAHMCFDCSINNNQQTGLKLEWLPNAFPRSHFGIMNIEFQINIRDPNKI